MLIYGYKGSKCLKSDNCNDDSIKNIIALKKYNEDLFHNYHWDYFDLLLRHVYHTYNHYFNRLKGLCNEMKSFYSKFVKIYSILGTTFEHNETNSN